MQLVKGKPGSFLFAAKEGYQPVSSKRRAAVDLVNACKQYKVPIGHQLANLICELLEVDIAQRGIKKSPQRQRAAEMLAHGGLTLRKVARAVNVNVGTVSRWRKEEEFKLEVERLRQAIKSSIPSDSTGVARKRGVVFEKVLSNTPGAP